MELEVVVAALCNMWVGKGSLGVLFVDVDQTNVTEVAAALDDWGFVDDFLKYDVIMST